MSARTWPRALEPWRKELSLFPDDLALVLGELTARLATVMGPGQKARSHEGAPDGLAGLARRGTYERLLLSEWLLHEELPDEFMRRVVAGEHAFLERAYRQEGATRRVVALFDAGVHQLGAPRIVQLASLLVLAQRAERLGASFEWGILSSDDELCGTVTAGAVLTFLRGRSQRAVSLADVERWESRLAGSATSELWLIGGEGLAASAPRLRASRLSIEEALDAAEPARVVVTMRPEDGRPRRSATLELPAERACVRLLRDPFGVAPAPRGPHTGSARIDPTSNIVFSPDGRLLYLRGAGGTLITVAIPNSKHAVTRAPGVFAPPEGHRIVAVGQLRSKKRTAVVTWHEGDAFLHVLTKRATAASRTEHHAASDYAGPNEAAPLVALGVVRADYAVFVDGDGSLVHLFGARNDVVVERRDAFAVKALRDGLAYAERLEGSVHVMVLRAAGRLFAPGQVPSPITSRPTGVDVQAESLFFGASGIADLVATCSPTGSWALVRSGRVAPVAVDGGATVVGVVERGFSPTKDYLVTLDASRTRIALSNDSESETVAWTTADDPIVFAAASDAGRELAYVTSSGALVIYSCMEDSVVLRLALGGRP